MQRILLNIFLTTIYLRIFGTASAKLILTIKFAIDNFNIEIVMKCEFESLQKCFYMPLNI